MSFALVLKKMSWYRRRYSRPLRVKQLSMAPEKIEVFDEVDCFYTAGSL